MPDTESMIKFHSEHIFSSLSSIYVLDAYFLLTQMSLNLSENLKYINESKVRLLIKANNV